MNDLLNIGQTLKQKKSGPVAKHINEICPNLNFLTITLLENVPRKIHNHGSVWIN